MICHDQLPSDGCDISGVTVTTDGVTITVAGSARLLGRTVAVSATLPDHPDKVQVGLHVDGTVDTAGFFATLAWRDVQGFHVIKHPTPEEIAAYNAEVQRQQQEAQNFAASVVASAAAAAAAGESVPDD